MCPLQKQPKTHSQPAYLLTALIAALILSSVNTPASAAEVESIHIFSTHGDIGGFQGDCNFEINRKEKNYQGKLVQFDMSWNVEELQRRGLVPTPFEGITDKELIHFVTNHKQITENMPVDAEKIEHLLQIIRAEPIPKLDIAQFGLTQEWLRENAIEALEKKLKDFKPDEFPDIEIKKKELVPELIKQKHIHLYYSGKWTDDHPIIKLTVHFNDGKTLKINSKAQHTYMVPWQIETESQTIKSYDLRITKAINKILPPRCPAFEKIAKAKKDFFYHDVWEDALSDMSMYIFHEKKLKALGDQISPVSEHFTILNSLITDSECCGKTENEDWDATLLPKAGPKNIFVNWSAPIHKGKLDLTGYTIEKVNSYIDRMTSIPWLKNFMDEYPDYEYSISFKRGRSVSESWYQNYFLKKFEKRADYGWPPLNRPYSEDIVHFEIRVDRFVYSSWLVFPDQNMVLNGYLGNPVLKWDLNDIKKGLSKSGYKGGLTISPSGEILSY